ncbi:Beta,beta-carotene 9',10'-oxygenase [Halotydeus destructor]|nr:Beta,beta-carotene 9',10'-oxygenase [Halotydeus destructor]
MAAQNGVSEESSTTQFHRTHFRSCEQEVSEPISVTLTGKIPTWLNGSLIRNGPGCNQIGSTEYKHLFDGLALLREFAIDGKTGTVTYRSKFLSSETYKTNMEAQRIVVSEFGTHSYPDPCKSILQKFMTVFKKSDEMTDNANINVYPIGDRLYASTETPYLHEIDTDTLESVKRIDVSSLIAVNTHTAHPHIGTDGTVYNLGSHFKGTSPSYNVIQIEPPSDGSNPLEKAKIICSIPVKRALYPSYYHSFSMTENYIVFIEQALFTSIPSLALSSINGASFGSTLKWSPKYMNYFHLVDRRTGQLVAQRYKSDPFSFFHTINAFEDGDHVVVDICCYSDGRIVDALYRASVAAVTEKKLGIKLVDAIKAEARRFVLPLNVEKENGGSGENLVNLTYTSASAMKMNDSSVFCVHESLTTTGYSTAEFPQINYKKYNGKKYRYFYGISRSDKMETQLIKVDLETKTTKGWSEVDHYPMEPIFVEDPSGNAEDDGVILSTHINESNEKEGFLIILDAKTFTELARASITTPSALTYEFHGLFQAKT